MKIENCARLTKEKKISNITINDFFENLIQEAGTITRKTMLEDDACISCVNVISNYIAAMQPQLFQKTSSEDINKIDNTLSYLLKNRPTNDENGFLFVKKMIQNMLVNTKSFALISTKKGAVNGLEIIENAIISEQNGTKFITYTDKVGNYHKKLLNEFVIFDMGIDLFAALKPILEIKYVLNRMMDKSFTNDLNSNIKAYVSIPEELDTEPKIALKKAINTVLNSESDGIAILDGGMTLNQLSTQKNTFAENQVQEILEKLDAKIYSIFGVPSAIVGKSNSSQYSVNEDLVNSFIDGLLPYILMVEQEYNYKLLHETERNDTYFKLNNKNLMRFKITDKANYYKTMVDSNIMDTDEVRALEEMKPRS